MSDLSVSIAPYENVVFSGRVEPIKHVTTTPSGRKICRIDHANSTSINNLVGRVVSEIVFAEREVGVYKVELQYGDPFKIFPGGFMGDVTNVTVDVEAVLK